MEQFGIILLVILIGCGIWLYYPEIHMEVLMAKIVRDMIRNNQAPTTFVIKEKDLSQLRSDLITLNYRIIIEKREKSKLCIKVYRLQ